MLFPTVNNDNTNIVSVESVRASPDIFDDGSNSINNYLSCISVSMKQFFFFFSWKYSGDTRPNMGYE